MHVKVRRDEIYAAIMPGSSLISLRLKFLMRKPDKEPRMPAGMVMMNT